MDETHIEELRALAVEAYNEYLVVFMDLHRRLVSIAESKEPLEKAQNIMQNAHSNFIAGCVELKVAAFKAKATDSKLGE
jgi:hypothetical protein